MKKDNLKISVIIPVHNSVGLIENCIDSICSQTINKEIIEIILINDASTDESLEICLGYKDKYNYIEVVNLSENSGPSIARNEGIKRAMGEYLFFADADDWLGPDCLRRLLLYTEETGADAVIGRVTEVNRRKKRGRVAWCRGKKKEISEKDFEDLYEFYASMGPWGRLVKRNLLISNDILFPIDMYMFEDIYWNMMILHCASDVRILNDYDYYYLRRDDGIQTLTTNDTVLNKSIRPENLYVAIDKLSQLAEVYGYGAAHPAWKRIFNVAVRDALKFITYAAKLAPTNYPKSGKKYKQMIWERVRPHYSAWVRNNIPIKLAYMFDAMMAGLDVDNYDDTILYYVSSRASLSKTAELMAGCDAEEICFPKFLSRETKIRLLAEQFEGMSFYGSNKAQAGIFRGQFFLPFKVTDSFEIKMFAYANDKKYPLDMAMKSDVWGEAYQDIGTWTAEPIDSFDIYETENIEFQVEYNGLTIRNSFIEPWDKELNRPEIINPDQVLLKKMRKKLNSADIKLRSANKQLEDSNRQLQKTKKQLKDSDIQFQVIQKQLEDNQKQLDIVKEQLKEEKKLHEATKENLNKIKRSKSWMITKPLRRIKKLIRGNYNEGKDN